LEPLLKISPTCRLIKKIQGYSYRVRLDIGPSICCWKARTESSTSRPPARTLLLGSLPSGQKIQIEGREMLHHWRIGRTPMMKPSPRRRVILVLPRGYVPETESRCRGRATDQGTQAAGFRSSVMESAEGVTVRNPLPWFIATAPTGGRVNVNYASRILLQSIPDMTSQLLESILRFGGIPFSRTQRIFETARPISRFSCPELSRVRSRQHSGHRRNSTAPRLHFHFEPSAEPEIQFRFRLGG